MGGDVRVARGVAAHGLTRRIPADDIRDGARPRRIGPGDVVVVTWGPESTEVEWTVEPHGPAGRSDWEARHGDAHGRGRMQALVESDIRESFGNASDAELAQLSLPHDFLLTEWAHLDAFAWRDPHRRARLP